MLASLLSLLAATAYGVGDFFGTLGTRRSHPILVSFIGHFFYATTALVGLWIFEGAWSNGAVTFGVLTGASEALGFLVFYYALGLGQVALVAPLVSVIYAVVPVFWGISSGNKISPIGWGGIAVGLLAVLLLSFDSSEVESQSRRPLIFVLTLSLIGGIMWGFSTVALSYVPHGSGMVPVFVAALTAFALLSVTVLIRRKAVIPQFSKTAITYSFWSGFLFGVANLLIISALRVGTLALVGLLTALYPLATVLLARFVLKERISRLQWAGIGLAICSAAILGTS